MNCPICGSPNPEGRVSCIVCKTALRPYFARAERIRPGEWLTERLRRTFKALLTALLGGAIALLYFSLVAAEPVPAPAWAAMLAVLCGGLAVGGVLGLLGPAFIGGIRNSFWRAREVLLRRQVRKRLERIIAICQQAPPSKDSQGRLGAALHLKGEGERALAILEEVAKAYAEDAILVHNCAVARASRGWLAQALQGFQQVHGLLAEEVAQANLALAMACIGHSREAAEACRRAWERQPGRVDLLNALVIVLAETGHAEEALARLQSGLASNPADPDLLVNLGALRFRLGDFGGACQEFLAASRQERVPRWGHHNAGLCCLLRGQLTKARAFFSMVLRQQANFAPALGQSAMLHYACRRSRQALEELREAARHSPADFEIRHNLAFFLLEEGKEEEALVEAERALELRPDNHDALVNLTAAGYLAKRYRNALEAGSKAIALFPGSAPAHYNLALVLDALERYEEAIAQLGWLKERYPGFAAAWNNLGVVRLLTGQTVEAAGAFMQASNLLPEEPRIRSNLALSHYQEGDFTAASQEIEIASRKAADLPSVLDILGHIHSEKKRPGEAIKAWARLASLETTNVEILTNLGIAYYRDDQTDAAVDCFRRVLLLLPRSLVGHNNLGLGYAKNKLLSEALHHLGKVVEIQPENPIVHSNVGLVRYFRGETEEAMWHWREVTRLSPAYARRREATRLSAYDDSEMVVFPVNRRRRALRFPPQFAASCHEARFSVPPPRFRLLLPWPDLAEIAALQEKLEVVQSRLHQA